MLSTTTPLYTLLLAATGLVWPDLPVTSHVLSMPALFAGALLLYLLCARHGKPVAGLALARSISSTRSRPPSIAPKSILHVALIFAALYAYDGGRLEWAAVWSALAVLNRGDGVLLRRRAGAALAADAGAGARNGGAPGGRWRSMPASRCPGIIFSWLYYGTLAPATMSAKMAQGALPNAPLFGPGLGFWWLSYAAHSPSTG